MGEHPRARCHVEDQLTRAAATARIATRRQWRSWPSEKTEFAMS
jgi:hypothetical protein